MADKNNANLGFEKQIWDAASLADIFAGKIWQDILAL